MAFRPKDRFRILLTIMLILGLCAAVSSQLRQHAERHRADTFRAHLDRLSDEMTRAEQARIDAGEVWVGELHGSIDELPEAVSASQIGPTSMSDMINQRRLARTLPMPGSRFSVNAELHECHAGLPLCSTGGSIQVLNGLHSICSVSVGLLQPTTVGQPASRYRVHWLPKPDGSELTLAEKLEIVQQLAVGGRPTTPAEFRRLMAIGYSDEMQENPGADREQHLRSIIATIFSAIAVSQDA